MQLKEYHYKLDTLVKKYNARGGRYTVQGVYNKNDNLIIKLSGMEIEDKFIGLYEFVFNPEYKFYLLLSGKKETTIKPEKLINKLYKLFIQGGLKNGN